MPHNHPNTDNAFYPLNGAPPPIGSLIKFSVIGTNWKGANFRLYKTNKWYYVPDNSILTLVDVLKDFVYRNGREIIIAQAWLFLFDNKIFSTSDPGQTNASRRYNWEYVPCE